MLPYRGYRGLSVSVSRFVYCAQTAEDIDS